MKLLLAGLALVALGAAFAIGWRTAGEPPTVVAAPARRGLPAVVLADPNPRGRFGVGMLAGGLTDTAAPAADMTEAAIAAAQAFRPPEPDVAYAFRRQLSAVVAPRPGGPYYALLTGEMGRRTLRPGEAFENGWRLARLDLQRAVFARGREQRAVDLFAPAEPVASAAPAAPDDASAPPADAPAASSSTEGVPPPPLD